MAQCGKLINVHRPQVVRRDLEPQAARQLQLSCRAAERAARLMVRIHPQIQLPVEVQMQTFSQSRFVDLYLLFSRCVRQTPDSGTGLYKKQNPRIHATHGELQASHSDSPPDSRDNKQLHTQRNTADDISAGRDMLFVG